MRLNKRKSTMQIYRINGITPVVDQTAFVHPSAVLIGDVIVGPGVYIGPCASLRGDFGRLILERGSNIQDTCVMHGFPGTDTVVEENGHIGHGAVLHSCRIGRNVLVGMNAVIMDGAVISENSVVAACSFVKAAFTCPPKSLIAGTPAKVQRPVSDDELAWKTKGSSGYHALVMRCRDSLQKAEPLTESEPDRRRFEAGEIRPLHETRR